MISWIEYEILGMSRIDYGILYLVAFAFLIGLLVYSFNAVRRIRFMGGTATSRIRSAAQGLVELKGLAEFMQDDVIVSPFSGERCIWYHCRIDKRQRKRSGRGGTWTNISDEMSEHLFRLVDDTGECIVDPDHARVIPEIDNTWMGHGPGDKHRYPAKKSLITFGTREYRFCERLIRPATSLYVLGWLHTVHSNPSDEYVMRQADDLVKQWKLQPKRYLADFDLDKNGKIQQREWKAVRAAARKQVLARLHAQKSEHHVLKRSPERKHPYIISAVDEKNLLARKQFKARASMSAGFIIFCALVFMSTIRVPFGV